MAKSGKQRGNGIKLVRKQYPNAAIVMEMPLSWGTLNHFKQVAAQTRTFRSEARSDEAEQKLIADHILQVLGYQEGLNALQKLLLCGSAEGVAVDLAKKSQKLAPEL